MSFMDPVNVSVKAFLDVITHGRTAEAWVCSVADLTSAPTWFGGRYAPAIEHCKADNNYYSLGLIKDKQRTLDQWAAGTLVVLDDVGEKTLDEGLTITACLGAPTFIVQTSKSSAQWGYVLTQAITDPNIMARLQRALTLKFYPAQKDPGHERIIQYLRLPCGVNNKPKRVTENGGVPFPVRLTHWEPTRTYDPLDLMMSLGDAFDATQGLRQTVSAGGLTGPRTTAEARSYQDTDEVLAGLDHLGMVHWNDIQNNGYIRVTCPWGVTHTIQDDRTGYNPEERKFSCMHSNHGPKNRDDVLAWLRAAIPPGEWAALLSKTRSAVFNTPVPTDQELYAAVVNLAQVLKPGRPKREPICLNPPSGPLDARRTVLSHLARGEVTYRIAAPGQGKSAISLAYAAAVAHDTPGIVGEIDLRRAGRVIILTNEDSAMDYRKRLVAWKRFHKDPTPIREIEVDAGVVVVSRAEKNGPVELHPDMDQLGRDIQADREAGIDTCLVIVDTQASTFRGLNENDAGDMGTAMSLLSQWARTYDVAAEVVHHGLKANERSGGGGKLVSARGSGAAGGSVRNMVTLSSCTDDQIKAHPDAHDWTKEEGAKSNHGPLMRVKWWKRELVGVDVVDPLDPTTPQPRQMMPVYVYHAKMPFWMSDPLSEDNVAAAVQGVADAERAGTPLRVRKAKGSTCAWEDLAGAKGWTEDDAKTTLKRAAADGHVREATSTTAQRNDVAVWRITAKGQELLERRSKILDQVDEDADSGPDTAHV